MNPASVLICKGCMLSLDYDPTINSNALNAWVQKNQFSNLCAVFSGQVANNERNHLFETFTKPSATLSPASNSEVSALVPDYCVPDAWTSTCDDVRFMVSESLAHQRASQLELTQNWIFQPPIPRYFNLVLTLWLQVPILEGLRIPIYLCYLMKWSERGIFSRHT